MNVTLSTQESGNKLMETSARSSYKTVDYHGLPSRAVLEQLRTLLSS